jgi:4-amino-4-deoxy-L-arabinose transferase-like glycosyltransferase
MMNSAKSQRAERRLADHYRLILVIILLVAAVLRLYGLDNVSPPGLEHDEVAHWIINRDILAGNHSLYFADAYGHEAGFHYLQTGFSVLVGENALVLRLPSAYAGLLLIAVSFALARRLFGLQTALLAAGLLAVLFWPVFYSRLALRAIALPLLSGLSAYFWWRGWPRQDERLTRSQRLVRSQLEGKGPAIVPATRASLGWFALAGLMAGLTFYTYLASRAVPVFYLLFSFYLLLCHHRVFRHRWRGILVFFGIYALVAAPLGIFLLSNPGIESRIGEVDAPLLALTSGNLRPALENTLKFIAMFGLRGDPLWRQNVALLPVFDAIVSLFFYIGLLISLWRWRQTRYMFGILWLFTSAMPSILTIDAPSSIRMINALPILTVFPAIGLEVIHLFRPLSTVSTRLSPVFRRNLTIVLFLLLFIFNAGRTWRAIFHTWPANDEVQFVWQQALTDAAGFLDSAPESGPVAIGGWTPETMDPPTMELALKREDLSLRYFDPGRAVIIPAADQAQKGRILHPTALPLHPALLQQLSKVGVQPEPQGTFTYYEVGDDVIAAGMFNKAPDASFGGEISLLSRHLVLEDDSMEVMTIWRVEKSAMADRSFFVHLIDESGDIVGQDDAQGAPAAHWQAGDIIIQRHAVALPNSSEPFQIRLGVYDPWSGVRLLTVNGADFVTVSSTTVQ